MKSRRINTFESTIHFLWLIFFLDETKNINYRINGFEPTIHFLSFKFFLDEIKSGHLYGFEFKNYFYT